MKVYTLSDEGGFVWIAIEFYKNKNTKKSFRFSAIALMVAFILIMIYKTTSIILEGRQ